MASFRIREDAYKWFSEVEKSLPESTIFDLYYFCLVAGLISGRSSDPPSVGASTKEMVGYFVIDFKPAASFLIAMLVIAELKKGGIDVSEEGAVREVFRRLVTQGSESRLTDEGTRRMNAYASGGYEYLAECRDQKPGSGEEFLRDFVTLVGDALPLGAFAQ